MNGKFKSCKLGFVTLLVVAFFVLSATAYAQAAAALPSCSNGVQDGNETGVDCGGKCVVQYVLEVCDGRDNDKDCLVDEDCKTNTGQLVSGGKVTGAGKGSQQANPTCSDNMQNQDELAVDCGGVCVVSAKEVCDGIDNDKDCYVDEGVVCDAEKKTTSGQEQQESEEVGQQPGKNITGGNAVGDNVTAVSSAGGAAGGSSADSVTQESSGTSALGNAGGAESPAGDDKQNEPDGKPGSSKELAIPIEEPTGNTLVSAGNADSAQPDANAATSKSEKEVKTVSDAEEGGFFKSLFKKFFRIFGGKS